MWGDLGQSGMEVGKIELGIDIDLQSRLKAAGRAGIFDLCIFHNYGTLTAISSLPYPPINLIYKST